MKKHIIISALSVIAMAAMTMNHPLAVNAADSITTKGKAVTFASYLRMDKEAAVPNATFTYKIVAYGDSTVGNYSTLKTTGTPTIGSATFAQDQTTYTDVKTMDSTISINNKTNGTSTDSDAVTLGADQKYARTAVTVDFSNVVFQDPGTYYYLITEDKGADAAIDYDTTPNIMAVYTMYDSTGTVLNVGGYVMCKATATTVDGVTTYSYNEKETKADGFLNDYDTENLTLSKIVSGNQASHDEYFQFDVAISGAQPGITYPVVLAKADASTKVNGASNIAHTNITSITIGSKGSATATFWLQHGQYLIIEGIARGTQYVINENVDTVVKTEGYTPSVAVTGDIANGGINTINKGTYTVTEGTGANKITLNADKTATLQFTDSATNPATDTTVTGKWSQSSYKVTFTTTISGTDYTAVYDMSVDGKTLTLNGTPTISTITFIKGAATSTDADVTTNDTIQAITMDATTTAVVDSYISEDTKVEYTNTKQGTIPTGIILNTAPYALVVVFGFAGLLFFTKKKRESEAEEY